MSDLKDSTLYPAFLIVPAMNPRTVCFCQPILSIKVRPTCGGLWTEAVGGEGTVMRIGVQGIPAT